MRRHGERVDVEKQALDELLSLSERLSDEVWWKVGCVVSFRLWEDRGAFNQSRKARDPEL